MAERGEGPDADAEAARARGRDSSRGEVACIPGVKLGIALFAVSNPSVSASIAQPVAHGRVRVVVVGAGGSTLVQVPVETMEVGGARDALHSTGRTRPSRCPDRPSARAQNW